MKNKNGNNSDDIFITEADKLKEILGERAKEDLLDELFKRFCIGK